MPSPLVDSIGPLPSLVSYLSLLMFIMARCNASRLGTRTIALRQRFFFLLSGSFWASIPFCWYNIICRLTTEIIWCVNCILPKTTGSAAKGGLVKLCLCPCHIPASSLWVLEVNIIWSQRGDTRNGI
ncbi:hypothetical protein GGS20DRAFT_548771 [Poronia punctata]|nr:hypothetical protein GGS20DRAFT_548771 [Poronia punctata]